MRRDSACTLPEPRERNGGEAGAGTVPRAASGAAGHTLRPRRQTVEPGPPSAIAPGDQSFTGVSIGELRDPNGNLLPGSNIRRDTEVGTRINVEPLPTQP